MNSRKRFNPDWFDPYGSWLEYNISKSLFCLYCYLFKHEVHKQGGNDASAEEGFNSSNKI